MVTAGVRRPPLVQSASSPEQQGHTMDIGFTGPAADRDTSSQEGGG